MKYLTVLAGIALCFASCATDKSNKADTAENECKSCDSCKVECIGGQWKLAEYNVNDSVVKIAAEEEYVLNFMPADSAFNMTTNCNSIGGKYILCCDSIKFDNMFSTRMMCPDLSVEEAMNQVFANANKVACCKDSVLQLKNDDKVLAEFNKMAAAPEEANN